MRRIHYITSVTKNLPANHNPNFPWFTSENSNLTKMYSSALNAAIVVLNVTSSNPLADVW